MSLLTWLKEKINPAQSVIHSDSNTGGETSERNNTVVDSYKKLAIVRRGVDLITNAVSELDFEVISTLNIQPKQQIRVNKLNKLLNIKPNPYQNIDVFRRKLVLDYLLEGNVFIYYDGSALYHLPAYEVKVVPDPDLYIEKYIFQDQINFFPDEIIQISDNSFQSGRVEMYRGSSRLNPALDDINLLTYIQDFRVKYFKNGTIPGLILSSEAVLSPKMKKRMQDELRAQYGATKANSRQPMIIDGGMKLDKLLNAEGDTLDFENSVVSIEDRVLGVLGVPRTMLQSQNNVQQREAQVQFYYNTVLPMASSILKGIGEFFNYKLKTDIHSIPALQLSNKEKAGYLSGLVNTGVITPNEARTRLGFEESKEEEMNSIRVPANITGSATNPQEGGRPEE